MKIDNIHDHNHNEVIAEWVPDDLLLWADNFDKTSWDSFDPEEDDYFTEEDRQSALYDCLVLDMAKMIDVIETYFIGYSVDYTAQQIAAAYWVSSYSPFFQYHKEWFGKKV